jgi:2-dehydro-3-deoxyphosphogluconate aldolase/(4S)-4-hydroxy-2-oxoglutarate aldolase
MTASAAPSVLDRLEAIRIIPVVVIDDAAKAPDVAAALLEGGIGCAEITLRTPDGLAAIAAAAGVGDFVVGAGTVLDVEQVEACVDAGARFIVSPGFDDEIVAAAHARGVAVLPGVATATELQRARRAGLGVVKFFPADRLGGLPTIEALAAPFASMRFVPSGGVSATNAREYLAHPAIHSVSGSWMVTRTAIAAGDFAAIARLAGEAAALSRR